MAVARVAGAVLLVPGAILVLAGVAYPCSPSPVVSVVYWTPSCGDALAIVTVGCFFLAAGALTLLVSLRGPRSAPTLRQLGLGLGISAVALFTTFATPSLVPVHQSFTMHDKAVFDLETTCSGIDTLWGTSISFHWSAAANISFGVWSCSANWLTYMANGTGGSGSLVSRGGVYEFGTACPPTAIPSNCVGANVSGNYTRPLLEI
jgi:hypothetical protein